MLKWNGGSNATSLNMKKYLIVADTICNGTRVSAGDVIEITETEGFDLMASKKAVVFVKKAKAEKANRSVGLKDSNTKDLKKRSKK